MANVADQGWRAGCMESLVSAHARYYSLNAIAWDIAYVLYRARLLINCARLVNIIIVNWDIIEKCKQHTSDDVRLESSGGQCDSPHPSRIPVFG